MAKEEEEEKYKKKKLSFFTVAVTGTPFERSASFTMVVVVPANRPPR